MPATPIVFLGDSISEAWGALRADVFRQHGLICRGVGGETSRQIRLRLPHALDGTDAGGLHLLCGINDIAENEGPVTDEALRANIAAMVAEAQQRGIKVWLGSIMPAEVIAWRPHIDPRPRIAATNSWLCQHAERHGCIFLDYHSILASTEGALREPYSYDGVHLTDRGYLAIEPMMLAALRPSEDLRDG